MGMYRSKQEDLERVFMKDCGLITVGEDGGFGAWGLMCKCLRDISKYFEGFVFETVFRFYLTRR